MIFPDDLPSKEDIEANWRQYLAAIKPALDVLEVEVGLSRGEAIIALELNGVTNMLHELLETAEKPPPLPGDEWQGNDN